MDEKTNVKYAVEVRFAPTIGEKAIALNVVEVKHAAITGKKENVSNAGVFVSVFIIKTKKNKFLKKLIIRKLATTNNKVRMEKLRRY